MAFKSSNEASLSESPKMSYSSSLTLSLKTDARLLEIVAVGRLVRFGRVLARHLLLGHPDTFPAVAALSLPPRKTCRGPRIGTCRLPRECPRSSSGPVG